MYIRVVRLDFSSWIGSPCFLENVFLILKKMSVDAWVPIFRFYDQYKLNKFLIKNNQSLTWNFCHFVNFVHFMFVCYWLFKYPSLLCIFYRCKFCAFCVCLLLWLKNSKQTQNAQYLQRLENAKKSWIIFIKIQQSNSSLYNLYCESW
jgi:hypothetical protein